MKKTFLLMAMCIIVILCANGTQAPDLIEIGYGKLYARGDTIINSGSTKEFSVLAPAYSSTRLCGNNNSVPAMSLNNSTTYFEGSLTNNSQNSRITKIIVKGSRNMDQGDPVSGAIVYSDKCPFDVNSVIDIKEFTADIRTNTCANTEIIPPVGTKSFRIYCRTYYLAGSPGSISTSGVDGRIQYGDNQTINIGNVSVWISLPGPIIDGFTLIPGYDGVITSANSGTMSTIVVNDVPYATDITNIVPENISLITGTSFAAGFDTVTAHDFSTTVHYEVTDGVDNRTYEITVNKRPPLPQPAFTFISGLAGVVFTNNSKHAVATAIL